MDLAVFGFGEVERDSATERLAAVPVQRPRINAVIDDELRTRSAYIDGTRGLHCDIDQSKVLLSFDLGGSDLIPMAWNRPC